MAYYSDPRRIELVVDCLRRNGPLPQRELMDRMERIDRVMHHNSAWKALQVLLDEGVVSRSQGRCRTGQVCNIFELEEWYYMDEAQRERIVRAWETMARCMEEQTEMMRGRAPKPWRETKETDQEETK